MTVLDYTIIVSVVILFVLAFISYRKKPGCSCGQSGYCSRNCVGCCKYENTDDKIKC